MGYRPQSRTFRSKMWIISLLFLHISLRVHWLSFIAYGTYNNNFRWLLDLITSARMPWTQKTLQGDLTSSLGEMVSGISWDPDVFPLAPHQRYTVVSPPKLTTVRVSGWLPEFHKGEGRRVFGVTASWLWQHWGERWWYSGWSGSSEEGLRFWSYSENAAEFSGGRMWIVQGGVDSYSRWSSIPSVPQGRVSYRLLREKNRSHTHCLFLDVFTYI